jgi:hypothetical protein
MIRVLHRTHFANGVALLPGLRGGGVVRWNGLAG